MVALGISATMYTPQQIQSIIGGSTSRESLNSLIKVVCIEMFFTVTLGLSPATGLVLRSMKTGCMEAMADEYISYLVVFALMDHPYPFKEEISSFVMFVTLLSRRILGLESYTGPLIDTLDSFPILKKTFESGVLSVSRSGGRSYHRVEN